MTKLTPSHSLVKFVVGHTHWIETPLKIFLGGERPSSDPKRAHRLSSIPGPVPGMQIVSESSTPAESQIRIETNTPSTLPPHLGAGLTGLNPSLHTRIAPSRSRKARRGPARGDNYGPRVVKSHRQNANMFGLDQSDRLQSIHLQSMFRRFGQQVSREGEQEERPLTISELFL